MYGCATHHDLRAAAIAKNRGLHRHWVKYKVNWPAPTKKNTVNHKKVRCEDSTTHFLKLAANGARCSNLPRYAQERPNAVAPSKKRRVKAPEAKTEPAASSSARLKSSKAPQKAPQKRARSRAASSKGGTRSDPGKPRRPERTHAPGAESKRKKGKENHASRIERLEEHGGLAGHPPFTRRQAGRTIWAHEANKSVFVPKDCHVPSFATWEDNQADPDFEGTREEYVDWVRSFLKDHYPHLYKDGSDADGTKGRTLRPRIKRDADGVEQVEIIVIGD
mmetsp:Transcript_40063/g.125408  ORF Transcript_40063/g.125408 Transcript_40063/m.125408 type:complete len:277 (-) Transcript_40063:1449-2279(-)